MSLSVPPSPQGDVLQLGQLFNQLADAAFLHDLAGRLLEVNAAACQALGYSREELLGMTLADISAPASHPLIKQGLDTLGQEGQCLCEAQHLSRNGEAFPVEIHSQIIPQDATPLALSVARDIRQRKRAELRLTTALQELDELTHQLDRHILRGEAWETLMQFLCRRLVQLMQLPLAWVGKRHPSDDTLYAVAAAGPAEPCLSKLLQGSPSDTLPEGTLGPALAALRSGQPQFDTADDAAWQGWADIVEGYRIHAGLAFPLIVRGKVEAVCSLYAETAEPFASPLLRTRLERLGDHLSLTLEMAMDHERMRLLNDALAAAGNPTFITDREGTIVWANQAFLNLSGFSMGEILGRNPRLLQSGRQSLEYYQQLWATITAGGTWNYETINRRKDGSLYVIQQTITPIRNGRGEITHYISIHEDITAKKVNQERIAHLAHHDVLTGLPNRRLLMEHLSRAIALARREGQRVNLLFLDLDGFKPINDAFGHLAGDHLLQEVAKRLQGLCRAADTVARLGGDEFIILLHGGTSDAERVARKVIEAMREPFAIDGHEVPLGASIGIALWPDHAQEPEELIAAADRAMYLAKRAGRGIFRLAPWRDHGLSHAAPEAGL